jgi:trehalose 6-phosphate synthase
LSVNPFDLEEQAAAIDEAISMDREERHERLEALREHVRTHDVGAWLETQLEDLDRWSAKAAR